MMTNRKTDAILNILAILVILASAFACFMTLFGAWCSGAGYVCGAG